MYQNGNEAKLFHNTGTFAAPVWAEVTNIRDLTLNVEKTQLDASTRASKWALTKTGLKKASVDFQMIFDAADTDYGVFRDAFFSEVAGEDELELAVMSEDIATVGAEGLHALFVTTTFNRNEPLDDLVLIDVAIAPTPTADALPAWMEVAA